MDNKGTQLIISGTAVFFIVYFWSLWELWKSDALIAAAQDPANSFVRGFNDAERNFSQRYARFKKYGGETPGISEFSLRDVSEQYHPQHRYICGFNGFANSDFPKLDIRHYKYNRHYVTAYNYKLYRLLTKQALQ